MHTLMDPLLNTYPYQRWSDSFIQPGMVGSVGDANLTPFLKTSCIDYPRRVEKAFAGQKESHAGSNVQDGDEANYLNAMGARTIDSNWDVPRRRKIQNGWSRMEIQNPDLLTEPFVSFLGDFSWRNQIARVNDDQMEVVPPGEFGTSGVPRGGLVPRTGLDASIFPGMVKPM